MKTTGRQIAGKLAAILLALATLSGCSGTPAENSSRESSVLSSSQQPVSSESETDEPIEIEIGMANELPVDSESYQEALKLLEEYNNVKLNFFYYGGNDQLPILLSSGDLPMVLAVAGSQMPRSHVIDSMAGGLFWDLTDYIPQFENLNALPDATYMVFSSGGRVYGLPRERNIGREGVGYRRDWVKQLGMGDADGNLSTFDELYDFMLAVPEKMGKYAIATNPLNYFGIWFTGVYQWKYEEDTDTMQLANFYPGYKDALDYCRELYAKGAIHPEFSIIPQDEQRRMWLEGEVAVETSRMNFAADAMSDPAADIGVNGVFPTDAGTYTMGAVGHSGGFFICKDEVEDEKTVLKILEVFNNTAREDVATLFMYGLEGKHYTVQNGMVVMTTDSDVQSDFTNNIYKPFKDNFSVLDPTSKAKATNYTYLQQRNIDGMAENAKYAVFSDTTGLVSPTNNERGADLSTIVSDADIRYVMGAIDWAAYEAELIKWREMGGDVVSEEFAEAYRAAHNID